MDFPANSSRNRSKTSFLALFIALIVNKSVIIPTLRELGSIDDDITLKAGHDDLPLILKFPSAFRRSYFFEIKLNAYTIIIHDLFRNREEFSILWPSLLESFY